jgi:hypothetical protein
MPLNLSSYTSITSHLFVRLDLSYINTVVRLSDRLTTTTILGETYAAAGNFLGITNTTSDLSNPGTEITISLAGIPNTAITDVINARLKGSKVRIYRGFFDTTTDSLISMTGRFSGYILNYAINEEYDVSNRNASNTITLICGTVIDILANTTKGRRTNPADMKKFYSTDVSMDRVPNLVGTEYDFGKK